MISTFFTPDLKQPDPQGEVVQKHFQDLQEGLEQYKEAWKDRNPGKTKQHQIEICSRLKSLYSLSFLPFVAQEEWPLRLAFYLTKGNFNNGNDAQLELVTLPEIIECIKAPRKTKNFPTVPNLNVKEDKVRLPALLTLIQTLCREGLLSENLKKFRAARIPDEESETLETGLSL